MSPQTISIIIPVLHEADLIQSCIGRLQQVAGRDSHRNVAPDTEIIVVDGDPDGSTIELIGDPAVRTIISPRLGRGIQMNSGMDASNGDILLFLHADTLLPPDAFSQIRFTLADPSIAGGAFSLGVTSERWSIRTIAALTTIRSRLTRIPYGDQAIFLRRTVFDDLGGFRDIPIMEDLDLMRRCRKAGHRIRILGDRVSTSPRRWEGEGVLRSMLRNWRIRAAFLLGVSPEKLVRSYRAHGDPSSTSPPSQ